MRRNSERDAEILRLYGEGMTVRELAPLFGVTYQRVSQVLGRHGVNGRKVRAEGNGVDRAWRVEQESVLAEVRAVQQVANGDGCAVCGGPKRTKTTCGGRCGEVYKDTAARRFLSEKARRSHDLRMAWHTIRNPERFTDAERDRAWRVIDGEPGVCDPALYESRRGPKSERVKALLAEAEKLRAETRERWSILP